MRKFTFNNMAQDSTYSRERISYRMFQLIGSRGTPKANTMKLRFHINGRNVPHDRFETYSNIQTRDSGFLEEHFVAAGTMWDMVAGSGLRVGLGACGNNSPLTEMECAEGCKNLDNGRSAPT